MELSLCILLEVFFLTQNRIYDYSAELFRIPSFLPAFLARFYHAFPVT